MSDVPCLDPGCVCCRAHTEKERELEAEVWHLRERVTDRSRLLKAFDNCEKLLTEARAENERLREALDRAAMHLQETRAALSPGTINRLNLAIEEIDTVLEAAGGDDE